MKATDIEEVTALIQKHCDTNYKLKRMRAIIEKEDFRINTPVRIQIGRNGDSSNICINKNLEDAPDAILKMYEEHAQGIYKNLLLIRGQLNKLGVEI